MRGSLIPGKVQRQIRERCFKFPRHAEACVGVLPDRARVSEKVPAAPLQSLLASRTTVLVTEGLVTCTGRTIG